MGDVGGGRGDVRKVAVDAGGEGAVAGGGARALRRRMRERAKVEPVFVDDPARLPELLSGLLEDGDLLVTQGAGNVGGIARDLAEHVTGEPGGKHVG